MMGFDKKYIAPTFRLFSTRLTAFDIIAIVFPSRRDFRLHTLASHIEDGRFASQRDAHAAAIAMPPRRFISALSRADILLPYWHITPRRSLMGYFRSHCQANTCAGRDALRATPPSRNTTPTIL